MDLVSSGGWAISCHGRVPAAPLREEVERDLGAVLGGLLTRDLSKVHPHSIGNADVSPQQRSYPVVIMRAGASAEVWNYSTLARTWPVTDT